MKSALPHISVLVGSGMDVASAAGLMAHADGAIAGTSLKHDGVVAAPVDVDRVRALRAAMLEATLPVIPPE